MAVCLATTTGDEVDNDDIVELVREDDEVELLNRAVTTSYSPLSFHVQLNVRSNYKRWLDSRLNSPTAGIYLGAQGLGGVTGVSLQHSSLVRHHILLLALLVYKALSFTAQPFSKILFHVGTGIRLK